MLEPSLTVDGASTSRQSATPSAGRPVAIVGRDAELDRLARSYASARAGHAQVVIIEAEAGMGKSALLEHFVRRRPGARVRWLRCDEFERDIAFAGAERLLGVGDTLTGCSEVEVGRRLLAWLGEQQSGKRVTVLAVDDAQWLDRPTLHALAFALRRLRADRTLSILTRRPGPSNDATVLTEDPAATAIVRLDPLDAVAVIALARRLRSWYLSDDLATGLVGSTGGVPLLVAGAIRGASAPAQLVPDQGGRSTISATVATAVARMLGSVAADARRLVEASAVLAEPVDLLVLGRMTEIPDAATAAADGARAGLLRTDADGSVRCAHDLLTAAVYRGLSPARRRDLHRLATAWTTGDRRLAHRAAASARPSPELVAELTAAADAARAAQRHQLAAAHRLRARSVCADARVRDELLLEAVIDLVAAQDLVGADELAATVDGGDLGALGCLALGLLARESGQVAAARRLLRDALDLAVVDGDRRLCERAGLAQAVLAVRLNEGEAAVRAVTWAEESDDPELAADACTTKALGLWQLGEHQQAIDVLDKTLSPAGDTPWDAEVLAVRAMVREYLGQLPEALADYDAAVALDPIWRPTTNHSRTRVLRATTRVLLGDWDGAAIDAAAARTLAQAAAQAWSIPLAYAVSADVPAWRGQFDLAADYLAEADRALQVLRPPQVLDFVVDHQLALATARGDHGAVVDLLEPLLRTDYLARAGVIRTYRWPYQCWIDTQIALGDLGAAERALGDYERALDRWPGGAVPPRLGWLRGRLAEARGEPLAARDHYASDLLCHEVRRAPFGYAGLLLSLGHVERVLGNRRDALDHLTKAHRIFLQLRANPAERLCAAELAACGLPASLADPLRLTPREEDVAALVERGYTNKEIAAELYLTPKTVEYHLGNIFAKLGISSRRELRRRRQG